MKSISHYIAPLLFLIVPASSAHSQTQFFHIGTNVGLPSAHIYRLLVDDKNYLWIATDKGVFRYNGYELRSYNLSSGLINEDIWNIHQDSSGRIWLASISDELPYILNEHLYTEINASGRTIYPKDIVPVDKGIAFISRYVAPDKGLCYITNGTLRTLDLQGFDGLLALQDKESFVQIWRDSANLIRLKYTDGIPKIASREPIMSSFGLSRVAEKARQSIAFSEHVVFIIPGDTILNTLSLQQKKWNKKTIDGGPIYFGYTLGRSLCLLTQKGVCLLDSSFRIAAFYPPTAIGDIPGIDIKDCAYFLRNAYWGNCTAIKNEVIVSSLPSTPFHPVAADLADSKLLGAVANSTLWWNAKAKTISTILNGNQVTVRTYPALTDLTSIAPYSNDSSLLLNIDKIYWYNNNTGSLSSFYKPFNKIYRLATKDFDTTSAAGGYNAFFGGQHTVYILSRTHGFCRYDFNRDLQIINYSSERYNNMSYDPYRKCFWLFSSDRLVAFKDGQKMADITGQELRALGIRNIEAVLPDKFGNVFIKEYDRLLMFNASLHPKNIFSRHIMTGAKVSLTGNLLTAAGGFGVLRAAVPGRDLVSKAAFYANIKAHIFRAVSDFVNIDTTTLLTTDAGSFYLSNTEKPTNIVAFEKWTTVLSYGDTAFAAKNGDTVTLEQADRNIAVDIINPYATGNLHTTWYISGYGSNYKEANLGAIPLPELTPDNYQLLHLQFSDDVWRSRPLILHIYIKPYWWQKHANKKWIRLLSVLVIALILGAVAFVTRAIIIKRNNRRNQQLELELKSVYAQLNPHFIFNTLSSTIFFINRNRLSEAVSHINKFSSLLRSYIRSSRNRTATIDEEVTNIRNYIELQQVRFTDKFDYIINVDPDISIKETRIPTLLLQPLVENAISHGLLQLPEKGLLLIYIKAIGNKCLLIRVEDNGIGRAGAGIYKNVLRGESFGSDILKDLIEVFSRYEQMKIDIRYTDKAVPASGTIVDITIQYL